ncbi:MAG: AraC family transcriptional regulator, partial [Agathobaculum butyriciproducens]
MQNWHDNVLRLIAEIDRCIRTHDGETLTLAHLARLLDCSQSQVSHQFHALTGTSLRDFVQARRPALALPAVRDGEQRLLDIALDCGFSSQEAFTRAFRAAYGITPGEYRRSPRPLSLRTVIRPLDCYLAEQAPAGTENDVFYHASGAQICTHSQLREHRLLGFYAKAVPHSRSGFGDGQRPSAAACT